MYSHIQHNTCIQLAQSRFALIEMEFMDETRTAPGVAAGPWASLASMRSGPIAALTPHDSHLNRAAELKANLASMTRSNRVAPSSTDPLNSVVLTGGGERVEEGTCSSPSAKLSSLKS